MWLDSFRQYLTDAGLETDLDKGHEVLNSTATSSINDVAIALVLRFRNR